MGHELRLVHYSFFQRQRCDHPDRHFAERENFGGDRR